MQGLGWCVCCFMEQAHLSVLDAVLSRTTSDGENPANLNAENPPTPSIMEWCTCDVLNSPSVMTRSLGKGGGGEGRGGWK